MKTIAMKNKNGNIKMNYAITANDICMNGADSCYSVQEKPMKVLWKQKIDQIQELIDNCHIHKDGRLMQLYKKKELLQDAFGRVK